MVKKSEKALKNALLQAEKHGVSDSFSLKNDLCFFAKYDSNNNKYIIVFENIEISFRDSITFLEFARSL